MDKLYKINDFASINCKEDNKEDTALQLSINLHTTDDMLMYMITSYCYGVKSYLETKRISQEEADKLLSEAGLSEISYEIVYDLKSKIGGYYTDSALKKRYDSLVGTEYFDICLEIFKRIKNEINNAKQQVNKLTKEQSERLLGTELIEQDGKLVYDSDLYLEGRKDITELPDNLRVLGYLDLHNSGITKLPKGLEVEGFLDISGTDIEELPEDIKLGGDLFLKIMNKPFSFPKIVKVNGNFECTCISIKRMPEELYVNGYCDLSRSTFDKLPKVMKIRYRLDLYDTPITELPKGLKEVYGRLNIAKTNVKILNENLVVYDELILGGTHINELPKGLIVRRTFDLRNVNLKDYSNLHKVCSEFIVNEDKYNKIKDSLPKHTKYNKGNIMCYNEVRVTFEPNYKGAYLFENENGKYIKAGKFFGKIVEQKGNVYQIQVYGSNEITYLVTNGKGKWSDGDTLVEAMADLIFKISERDKSDYENLMLDNELSFEDAIVCYRVITGAGSFDIKRFINNKFDKNIKDKYTIADIIELTEGEYGGNEFRKFFN